MAHGKLQLSDDMDGKIAAPFCRLRTDNRLFGSCFPYPWHNKELQGRFQ